MNRGSVSTAMENNINIGYSGKFKDRWILSYIHENHFRWQAWVNEDDEFSVEYCSGPLFHLLKDQGIPINEDFGESYRKKGQKFYLWLENLYSESTADRAQSKRDDFWGNLMQQHGEDIRSGRAYIVFSRLKKLSDSSRGDIAKSDWFSYFYRNLQKHGVPPKQIIVYLPVPEALQMYQNFCQRNKISKEDRLLRVRYINYYEMAWLQCFQFHNQQGNFLDVNKIEENLEKLRPRIFLCQNNEARVHRKAFFSWLCSHCDLNNGLVSFLNKYHAQRFEGRIISPFQRPENKKLVDDFKKFENKLPQVVDVDQVHITNYQSWPFEQSYYSIVTERVFNVDGWTLPTAKIYKTIHNLHPFIVLGQKGLLAELRRQGFETFPELFDESYDNEVCPDARFQKVCSEVARVNQWSLEKWSKNYTDIFPKLKRNREILESHWKKSEWNDEIRWLSENVKKGEK